MTFPKILSTNYNFFLGALLVFLGQVFGLSPLTANYSQSELLGEKIVDQAFLSTSLSTVTRSRFSEEVISKTSATPFEVKTIDDPQKEVGFRKVLQEGKEGTKTEEIKITYFNGLEYDRRVVATQIVEPAPRIVLHGTKIVIREKDVPEGRIHYFRRLKVWATSYDGNCPGCLGRTFSGTPVKHGTIAVDPSIIPLGTKIYVPGYGFGIAEDIGGGVKGNKIDLGFETLSGQWSAREVEIYLLE